MTQKIEILCDKCKTEFVLDDGCADTYTNCPKCGSMRKTGTNFKFEIGAPSPVPLGQLVKRTSWEETVGRERCQRDLTISEHNLCWILSYYEAPYEGRHPILMWQRSFRTIDEARVSFQKLRKS